MKLAEIYEVLGETRKALDLVYEGKRIFAFRYLHLFTPYQVIDSRKKRPKEQRHAQTRESTATAGTSLFAEEKTQKNKGITVRTQNRLNYNQLRELEAQKEKEVIAGYRKLKELWPALLASDPEAERLWLLEAEKLVEMFRETRNLFLTTRVCSVALTCAQSTDFTSGKLLQGNVPSQSKAAAKRNGRRRGKDGQPIAIGLGYVHF